MFIRIDVYISYPPFKLISIYIHIHFHTYILLLSSSSSFFFSFGVDERPTNENEEKCLANVIKLVHFAFTKLPCAKKKKKQEEFFVIILELLRNLSNFKHLFLAPNLKDTSFRQCLFPIIGWDSSKCWVLCFLSFDCQHILIAN